MNNRKELSFEPSISSITIGEWTLVEKDGGWVDEEGNEYIEVSLEEYLISLQDKRGRA